MGSIRQQLIAILLGEIGFGPAIFSRLYYLQECKPTTRVCPKSTKNTSARRQARRVHFQCCGPWYSCRNSRWALESCVDPLWGSSVDLPPLRVINTATDTPDSRKSLNSAIESNHEQLLALAKQYKEKELEIMSLENKLITQTKGSRRIYNSSGNLLSQKMSTSHSFSAFNGTTKVEVECRTDDLTSVKVTVPSLGQQYLTTMDVTPRSAEILTKFSTLGQSIGQTPVVNKTVPIIATSSNQQDVITIPRTCTDLTSNIQLASGQATHDSLTHVMAEKESSDDLLTCSLVY